MASRVEEWSPGTVVQARARVDCVAGSLLNLPASLAPAQGRLANQLEPDRSQDRLPALATFLRDRRSALLLPGTLRRLKSACTQVHGVDIDWGYQAWLPSNVRIGTTDQVQCLVTAATAPARA